MLTGISFITSYWPLSSLSIFNLKVDLKHEIRYLFGILFNTHRRDLLEEGQNTTTSALKLLVHSSANRIIDIYYNNLVF